MLVIRTSLGGGINDQPELILTWQFAYWVEVMRLLRFTRNDAQIDHDCLARNCKEKFRSY
jgi:hypothetical protein